MRLLWETEMGFLSLDHINNDGAADRTKRYGARNKSGGGGEFYRRLKKEGWPTGFQVLCMNCNFGKRIYGGVCPHMVTVDVTIDKENT